MKEKVGTLRVYFGLVGVVSGVANGMTLVSPTVSLFERASSLVYLPFSLAALYAAFALPALLRTRARATILVFRANAVLAGLRLALAVAGLLNGEGPARQELAMHNLLGAVVGFAIAWYLVKQIVRLAAEAQSGATAAPVAGAA